MISMKRKRMSSRMLLRFKCLFFSNYALHSIVNMSTFLLHGYFLSLDFPNFPAFLRCLVLCFTLSSSFSLPLPILLFRKTTLIILTYYFGIKCMLLITCFYCSFLIFFNFKCFQIWKDLAGISPSIPTTKQNLPVSAFELLLYSSSCSWCTVRPDK